MRCKLFVIASLIISAFFFSACKSSKNTMAPRDTSILGLIKHEPKSYAHTGPNTFALYTDEFFTRKNFSGDKYTLLWGLITIKDY